MITCGLPLSVSWKSSCLSVPMARPCLSRTTTGTITRFTRALKVAGSSLVVVSRRTSCPKAHTASAKPIKTRMCPRYHSAA